MNPVWDEDSLFTTYLIDRIFTWHDDPTSPHSAGWIATLLRPRGDEAALSSTSIRALATSYFGKMHGHVSLLQSGARQYSNALGALQERLNDSNLALEDDVLLSIICMSMYELVTVADPSAWVNHCKGLAQLVGSFLSFNLCAPLSNYYLDCYTRALSSSGRGWTCTTSHIEINHCMTYGHSSLK